MSVLCFYRHLSLKACGHVFQFWFSLEDKRGLSLGELIRPFCIMLLYQFSLHYGLLLHIMSQYLCFFSHNLQRTHQEEEFRQLEIWTWKSYVRPPILHNSKQAETWRRFFMEYIKNIGRKKYHRRATHRPWGWGARPPASWVPCWPSGAHLLLYEVFRPRKNREEAFGTRLRRHEAEPI